MAKKEWITSETIHQLQGIFLDICERDGKPPTVAGFIQEIQRADRKEEFTKSFDLHFEIPSKSWFDNKTHLPAWRKMWLDNLLNPPVEDSPWSLGATINQGVAPAVISLIFEMKAKTHWDNMTLREAKWISRMSSFQMGLEVLRMNATRFAKAERLENLCGQIYFNSHKLDMEIASFLYGIDYSTVPLPDREEQSNSEKQPKEEKTSSQWNEWLANYDKNHGVEDIEMRCKLAKEIPETLFHVLLIQKNSEEDKNPLSLAMAFNYYKSKYQKDSGI